MTDLSSRNESKNSAYHTKPSPENRHNPHLFAGQHFAVASSNRGGNFSIFKRQVTGDFVGHQHGYFFEKFPEFFWSGFYVPNKRQFMLYQRVVNNFCIHLNISNQAAL
ncbi:hypothetical protein SDC9_125989 [bioreactor metagenome]|uniref:Uncharacterized protein n=1 Tax=bioreactor metagenome TaxID=1076179 RepID=A0A645CQ18_9ZZZZ